MAGWLADDKQRKRDNSEPGHLIGLLSAFSPQTQCNDNIQLHNVVPLSTYYGPSNKQLIKSVVILLHLRDATKHARRMDMFSTYEE